VRKSRLDDRGVELAAVDENRSDEIQEHQRDDHRGEPRIHRHVIVGEARQILTEHDARDQRRHDGEDDAGQDLEEPAPSRRQPGMQDQQRHHQCADGDTVAQPGENPLVGFDEQRNVGARGLDEQRSEHDQEGHGERGEGRNQRVGDRFQP